VNSCFNFSANGGGGDDDGVSVTAVMVFVRNMYLVVKNHV